MKKAFIPVLIILLVVLGALLSDIWFSTKENSDNVTEQNRHSNNIDTSQVDYSPVQTTEDLIKNYNKSSNNNSIDNNLTQPNTNNTVMPNLDEIKQNPDNKVNTNNANPTIQTNFGNSMSTMQNLFYNEIGTNQIFNYEAFDGNVGSGTLEIYNKQSRGLYKFRYVYSETVTSVTQGVELNFSVGNDTLNVNSFKLDDIHRVLSGVSLEPYMVTQMNTTIEEYRKIAQVNGLNAADNSKSQYKDFDVQGIQYRISTLGNIITISTNCTVNK